ncbi:hypothetical protein GZH53_05940 [Flavihumibacter sp. R14]|nr:hypothetical protein [Flavihumibacter soli]
MKPTDLNTYNSGAELSGQSLVPVGNSIIGKTKYKDWLDTLYRKNSSLPHWEKFTEIKNPHTSDGDEFLDDSIRTKVQPFGNDRMREK